MLRLNRLNLSAWLGLLTDFGFFIAVFGLEIVKPSHISWLLVPHDANLQMDKPYHFLGWHYLRFSDWSLPLGSIDGYFAPFQINAAYSDSIPWLAVLAKAIVPRSAEPFQYSGLWLASCFALQGYFASRLMQELSRDRSIIFAGTLLMISAPVLLFRLDHLALCAHWMILAAITWALRLQSFPRPEQRRPSLALLWLGVLLAPLATATHPYLGAMISTIILFQYFFLKNLHGRWLPAVCLVLANGVVLVLFGYVPALVDSKPGSHYYAADVFTFLNSMGRSALVPGFPTWGGQYEGFAYLGLGVILSLVCYIWLLRRHQLVRHRLGAFARQPLGLALLGLFIFALSYHVRFFSKWIIALDWLYIPLEPLTASFRSAGRFSWPLYYYLIALSVVWLKPYFNRPKLWLLLTLILGLQIADQRMIWQQSGFGQHFQAASYERLDRYLSRQGELRLMPPFINYHTCTEEAYPAGYLQPLAYFAAYHRLTLNSGSIANLDPKLAAAHCHREVSEFLKKPKPGVSYVIGTNWAKEHASQVSQMNCQWIDGYQICKTKPGELSKHF